MSAAARSITGDPELDGLVRRVLDRAGADANRDQLEEIMATAVRLATGPADRLDLKIANAALREMADAYEVFAPYREVPKVTVFGSARTLPDAPLYAQAREAARALAEAGWMVVTGAGPGIMAAAQEGAGPGRSFGVNIRLPFEQGANAFIASDPKLVEMKYFFTRKLMLMKESSGFIVLPGGFGTLDEAFELLTLLQTGKSVPAPIVLLDMPDDSYWGCWDRFLEEEVAKRGLISPDDRHLFTVTDDARRATEEILGFYRNYDSVRWVGDRLVLRVQRAPGREELAELRGRYSDLCESGTLDVTGPFPVERRDGDKLDLQRMALRFNHRSYGELRRLIDDLNQLPLDAPGP
ncbi:MAG TPA: TIGR00730 family Rossman fold protein [Acidimicrobiales bacterium]|nr:TIGR00730 family Rossman fold protein [Acidimicrobiales bacterium]